MDLTPKLSKIMSVGFLITFGICMLYTRALLNHLLIAIIIYFQGLELME